MASKNALTLYYAPTAYTQNTWTIWPVVVRAVRALAALGIEWVSLDFIEHAPLFVRLATAVMASFALGVIETRDWLRSRSKYAFPTLLSLTIVTYLIVLGWSYWHFDEPMQSSVSISSSGIVARSDVERARLLDTLPSFNEAVLSARDPAGNLYADNMPEQVTNYIPSDWEANQPFLANYAAKMAESFHVSNDKIAKFLSLHSYDEAELLPLLSGVGNPSDATACAEQYASLMTNIKVTTARDQMTARDHLIVCATDTKRWFDGFKNRIEKFRRALRK